VAGSTVVVLGSFADSLIRFRGHLIVELTRRGCRVIACAPSASPEVVAALAMLSAEYQDVPLRRAGLNPFFDFVCFLSLWRLFRKLRPDVLLSYTIKPVVYGSVAASFARVPRRFAMITGLGFAFTGGESTVRRAVGLVARLMYRIALSCCHRVFFQNPDDLELFRSKHIISPKRLVTLIPGSGVDTAEYSYASPTGTADFLMIARLVRDKGVREYVEAARLVRAQFPQARFRLIGWIDENPSAITHSDLTGWVQEGAIEYLGRVVDVRPAISDCAVYVLPSYREGTPRTVLEAMAVGRAIVTTDAPGCRETVIHGENGFLVPVADSGALAFSLIYLLQHPELIASFGRKSRQIAEEKFDVKIVNRLLVDGMGL